MERSEDVLLSGGGINTNGDVNAVINPNAASSNSSNSTQSNNASDRPNTSYSMPGILHFLQHEWNRFEFERQQWELDRAELMTKISFLQGERRGQENLKNNLLRRIKMLEVALRQERIKFHKLKFGSDPSPFNNTQADSKNNTSSTSNDNDENETSAYSIGQHPILNKENTASNSTIKQGRQLLKQYLQEIGCTDTIIDVRSARLRSLLGKATSNQGEQQSMDLLTQANQLDPLSSIVNGNKQLLQLSINSNNKRASTNKANGGLNSSEVQKILKLSDNDSNQKVLSLSGVTSDQTNASAFYDDDEEMGEEEANKNSLDGDLDTEDALKEFAFLSSESGSDLDSSSDWNVDKAHLTKLTEQYKKDRKSAKNAKIEAQHTMVNTHRPNRSALQAMIVNLTEQSDENQSDASNSVQSNVSIMGSKSAASLDSSPNTKNEKIKFNTPNSLFSLEDDTFTNESNLGELSRISVGNTMNMTGISDETIIDSSRKTISNKHTLRGHFDSIRCLAFHTNESVLLSGSEDHTIKLWNLDKSTINSKKNSNTDIEPLFTFRKHTGPVLSLLVTPSGDHAISSGLDSKIIIWNMPNHDTIDQYDPYNPNVFVKNLKGHKDAVWNLSLVDNTLVSVSADSTVRVWNPFSVDELDDALSSSLSCFNEDKSEGIPTSVDFINNENSRIITSFGQSHHILYDLETSKSMAKFDFFDSSTNTHCYKVVSQPSSSLIVSAHEDKKIRFFDLNSGKMVYFMVAHQDACTDIAIDPTCNYLLSSSHDCSIRLWNLENKNCIQEMTSHRKKYDESINCVAFHATKPFVASGGADALIKIYV